VGEILALQLAFAVVIGLFAFGGVWWVSSWVIEDNMRKWGEQWITTLDELGMPLYVSQDTEKYIRIEDYVDKFPEISLVRYYSAAGNPIFTELPHQTNTDMPVLESKVLLDLVNAQGTEQPYILERIDQELPLMRVSKPIWTESLRTDGMLDFDLDSEFAVQETLVGFIELGLDFTNYQTRLTRNILLGSLGGVAALLFLTVASWFIYRRALQPLSQLQSSLEELAKGHTDFSVQATGHQEIVAIADALNTTMSALNERDKKLWQLANHDPLTGLINRHRFLELLSDEVDRVAADGTMSALLFIDLDQFKYVNDTVGHAAGDRLLKSVAHRLQDGVRETDVVSRFGGDEFLILLSKVSRKDVKSVCTELVRSMREYRFLENSETFTVPCSIGVTVFDNNHCTPTDLLAQADMACHHAKAQGRNRFHFFKASGSEMRQMVAEINWSQQIQAALREDLFVLRYQPIVDVHTGEPVFHEVLIRLQPENKKLVLPSAFLAAANRFGLMAEIDEWVIRHALEELGKFRSQYGDVRFTLNVSGNFFETPHLFQCLENSLKSNGVPLEAVVLEITEQVAVANMGSASEQIAQLANVGLKFAIDDFGAGYSSYNYLKTLPVDYIKIDGAFIKELAVDEVDQAIVSSISQIAQATDKKTIAEHVRDYQTLDVLRDLGVDYAQGYFLGKPSASLRIERTPVSLASERARRRRSA
jgi:diguanylate cyclase (GGDEF)-like protein